MLRNQGAWPLADLGPRRDTLSLLVSFHSTSDVSSLESSVVTSPFEVKCPAWSKNNPNTGTNASQAELLLKSALLGGRPRHPTPTPNCGEVGLQGSLGVPFLGRPVE